MPKRTRSPSFALALVLFVTGLGLGALEIRERGDRRLPTLVPAPVRPDLNASPGARLLLLPSIGPVRAAAIVEDRARWGLFHNLEDLMRVRGIGPKTVEDLGPLARVGSARQARAGGRGPGSR